MIVLSSQLIQLLNESLVNLNRFAEFFFKLPIDLYDLGDFGLLFSASS